MCPALLSARIMHSISAIVLAAGEGRRLRPLTSNRPKPLLPAANRPFLAYVFDELLACGVTDLTVVVGYRGTRIQNHFGHEYRGTPIRYVRQEKQLGSGHALLQAAAAINGPTVVVNGDQLVDSRIVAQVWDAHVDDAVATLAALHSDTVDRYGGLTIDDEGLATELVERPADGAGYLLNAGAYVVTEAVLDALDSAEPAQGELSLLDALEHLRSRGEAVRATVTEGYWIDATYPWDLLWVSRELFELGLVGEGSGPWIDDDAHVHETAVLHGPVVIGPDAEVGAGVVLGPYAAVGQNVTLGAGSVVQNAVLDADTRVGPQATLVDCVTGQGAHLGPANVVTGGPGDFRVGDAIFADEPLGAVLSDRVRTGGDVSFAPGTLVGPGAVVETGVVVNGSVPGEATVVR